jgi:hypothetical protein
MTDFFAKLPRNRSAIARGRNDPRSERQSVRSTGESGVQSRDRGFPRWRLFSAFAAQPRSDCALEA